MISPEWTVFDPTEPLQGLIRFFTFVGIWPTNFKYRHIYIIYGILFQFFFSYIYVGFEWSSAIYVTNLNELTEQIFVGLAEVSMCLRMTNFVVNFKEAEGFLYLIKSFKLHNQKEHDLYKKKLSLFSTVMTFYLTCASFAITFSMVAPLFGDEMKLPYPGWYPWDYKHDIMIYWILYVYQFFGIIFLAHTLVRLENYQIFCMICVGAQIEILGIRLKKIGYPNVPEKSSNVEKGLATVQQKQQSLADLLECIKMHKHLMKFVSDIERVFNIPFLFQFFCSSVIFCLTGIQIIMMDISNETMLLAYYISFSATMMNEIFLPCYFGTQLTEINSNLTTAVYSSNWPELSQSFKKTMILFLEYLKRPREIKSGKIFTLTLFSFLTVINRSYSLFAVLRNFSKK